MRNAAIPQDSLMVSIDALWTPRGGGVVGASVVTIDEAVRFNVGTVATSADLYAASIAWALAEIEKRGGLGDRVLVIRFPAKRGSAFAKLISQPENCPERLALSGHVILWRRLHSLRNAGQLRLGWAGALKADLAEPLQRYAGLAEQLPPNTGLLCFTAP